MRVGWGAAARRLPCGEVGALFLDGLVEAARQLGEHRPQLREGEGLAQRGIIVRAVDVEVGAERAREEPRILRRDPAEIDVQAGAWRQGRGLEGEE